MRAFNIWVTRKCNFKCTYCYEGIEKETYSMALTDAEKVAEFIYENSRGETEVSINYHGGEPLLNFETITRICMLLRSDKDKVYHFALTTNASLLDNKIINDLKKYHIYLSISLDGTEFFHDMNRKSISDTPTYATCIQNALLAKESGLDIRVRMTVVPNNCCALFENVKHLYEMGFDSIVAIPDFYSEEWTDELIDRVEHEILSIVEWNKDKKLDFVFFEDKITCKGKCTGGIDQIHVDANLDLYPCTYSVGKKKWIIGNIISGINDTAIYKIKEMAKERNTECIGCEFEPYCMSTRCKIINECITGNYNKSSAVICAFENIIHNRYH